MTNEEKMTLGYYITMVDANTNEPTVRVYSDEEIEALQNQPTKEEILASMPEEYRQYFQNLWSVR